MGFGIKKTGFSRLKNESGVRTGRLRDHLQRGWPEALLFGSLPAHRGQPALSSAPNGERYLSSV
jgi:hypothetical protein